MIKKTLIGLGIIALIIGSGFATGEISSVI